MKVLIYIRGHGEYREGISSLVSRLDPRVYRNPLLQFFRANFAVCISNMKQNEMNGFCHICFFLFYFICEYFHSSEIKLNKCGRGIL